MRILIIVIIAIVLLSLVAFTIIYNNKDRKKFKMQITNDNLIIEHDETGVETEENKEKSTKKL